MLVDAQGEARNCSLVGLRMAILSTLFHYKEGIPALYD
jgi:hypothetical protein